MKKGIVDDCWLIMQSNYHHSSIYYQVYYNYCELLIMYWKVVLWKILEYVLEGNWRQFLKVLELKNQSAQFSWLTFFKLDIWWIFVWNLIWLHPYLLLLFGSHTFEARLVFIVKKSPRWYTPSAMCWENTIDL